MMSAPETSVAMFGGCSVLMLRLDRALRTRAMFQTGCMHISHVRRVRIHTNTPLCILLHALVTTTSKMCMQSVT